ncbi:MAG: anthranilate phosphoribosyltransferase, partial [Acidobacteriota bacterium]
MIRQVLEALLAGRDLAAEEMEACFGALMAGELSEPQQAAFLVALRAKGETPAEVAAAAAVLRRFALPVESTRRPLIDTCGTGGDGAHTLNISTGAALVAAACGAAVAKHGNRSVSSKCGSADVLEALGMPLDLEPERLGELLDAEGFAFLFAARLHPAMRAVMPVRRSLAVRTVFNLLGPLANPAGVRRQVVGVYAEDVLELVAAALAELGAERAWVVHSRDGLDELSVTSPTDVVE